MTKMKKIFLSALAVCCMVFPAAAQNATITGIVTDGDYHDFLIGASVLLKGTTKGTIADVNGNYQISVPAGQQTVQYSFIGYKSQEMTFVLKPGEVKVMNVELHADSDLLQGVVVSAQAKGQQAAINDQLRSTSIINAVSSEKLSELPDVNVADAIGRLPGLMIQRDGGEGQKVIIRGLDPKYNTVAINGMNAPATGETDRSTDLNMISPEMIAGAEVMKANTADKDADGLGGTVNLIMKDAPHGLRLSVNGESGYHTQINGLGRAKVGANASNRFFDDKFGVIFGATFDRTDRSNDTFSTSYDVTGSTPTAGLSYTQPWTTGISICSNVETRTRSNVNLNFDIDLGGGNKIKMSNILSNLDRDRDVRKKKYGLEKNKLHYDQSVINNNTTNLSNVLQGTFHIGSSTLEFGAGHSAAWMETPWNLNVNFQLDEPYLVPVYSLQYIAPYDAISPANVNEKNLMMYYLYDSEVNKTKTYERELSAWLDWKTPFNIGDEISGYIKTGLKYRQKDRTYATEYYNSRFDLSSHYTQAYANMPEVIRPVANGGNGVSITNFIDDSFKAKSSFLGGYYPNGSFDFALDPDSISSFYDKMKGMYKRAWYDMLQRDYSGHEEMYAAYVMAEVNLGDWLTFLPGFRYDYSYLKYTGYSGTNVTDDEAYEIPFELIEKTDDENFGYLLPQIHLRLKPTDWMDVRLAYTKTLSRPDFNYLPPRTIIRPLTSSITWSRTNLKPILSTNYDVTVSFYPMNWGLFTVSAFYKDIENFIYQKKAISITGTETDPENFDLHSAYSGFTITYPQNSPTKAMIKGIELDAQLQLHHLSNFLKGFVVSANFTLMDSGMDYHTSNLTRERINGKLTTIYQDQPYHDRLIDQPSYLFNMSLGYDYKKFSGRVSCNYQDGVLITAQQRSDAADKEITEPFMKLDAQFKYKLNKRLALYMNFSNFNFALDSKVRYVTGFPENVEYYGATAYLGVKWDIIKK